MNPAGDQSVSLFVLGGAPGRVEDETGVPFQGPAGMLLKSGYLIPAGAGLAFLTNSVGCRTPQDRDPESMETSACTKRAKDLLQAVEPHGVLLVGRVAEKAWDSGAYGEYNGPVARVIHPSALLNEGYPNDKTNRKLLAQVARIRGLMAKASEQRVVQTAEQVTVAASEGCQHEMAQVGWWQGYGVVAPMMACRKCAVMDQAPAKPRARRVA
jgi:DNA polymerase